MLDTVSVLPRYHVPCPAPWQERLAPGDVVSFRFPVSDPGAGEAAKNRPCLVLEIKLADGKRHVILAYGTTSSGRANRGYEITVEESAALASAGLHEPTRFVGARRIRVPVSDVRFVIGAATGPRFSDG